MSINIKRIIAGIIDLFVICFVTSTFVMIVTLGKMNISFLSLATYFITTFLLLMFKDNLFSNASVGKKILKIKVIKIDQTKLNLLSNLKRTLPLFLLPLEILLIIISNKRIGDVWANTSIVEN